MTVYYSLNNNEASPEVTLEKYRKDLDSVMPNNFEAKKTTIRDNRMMMKSNRVRT